MTCNFNPYNQKIEIYRNFLNILFNLLAVGIDGSNNVQSGTKYSARSLNSNSDNDSFINWPGLNHSTNEHQTYAGYLKKQGHYFKQWKERYFVLDSIKHQVCASLVLKMIY